MSVCGHCGEKENFVPVQGIIFCGQCGRKVGKPQEEEPPPEYSEQEKPPGLRQSRQMNQPEESTAPREEAVKEIAEQSTASRLAALKARKANLSKTSTDSNNEQPRRQMSVQGYPSFPDFSKPESPLQMGRTADMGLGSVPERTDDHEIREQRKKSLGAFAGGKPRMNQPASGSLAKPYVAKRRVSGIAREVCQSNSGNESVFTLTKTKLAKIEAAIRLQVKDETLQQAMTDGSILEMEIEEIRLQAEAHNLENAELKNTLEEVMISFQDTLDGTRAKKNEQTAQIGILEMEHSQLTSSFESKEKEFTSITNSHEQTKIDYEKLIQDNATKHEKLHNTEQQLAEWREKYENLKTQASTKIRQAAAAYTGLQSSSLEKDTLANQLQDEHRKLKNRIITAGSRLEEAKQHKEDLIRNLNLSQGSLREKVQQYNNVHAQLSNAIAQYDILNENAQEIHNINTSYKDQVVQMREEIHKLKIESESGAKTELGMKRLVANVQKLQDDNRRLKSQLFDRKEIETTLRSQLSGNKGSLSGMGRSSSSVDQYVQDLALMQQNLEKKENENKELMSICEGLMEECEVLKQQTGQN